MYDVRDALVENEVVGLTVDIPGREDGGEDGGGEMMRKDM
jgi:hypothetical protein